MASTIISETIDAQYPVAGIDNDTQGFRDNFQVIKDNFEKAKNEITVLQDGTVKLDSDNNFQGDSTLIDVNLTQVTNEYHNPGTVNDNLNISFLNGHYQTITLSSEVTESIKFTLSDWPDREGQAKIIVELFDADESGNNLVTFDVEGGGNIRYSDNWPENLQTPTWPEGATNDTAPRLLMEFWTYNQGTTIYANYIGSFA